MASRVLPALGIGVAIAAGTGVVAFLSSLSRRSDSRTVPVDGHEERSLGSSQNGTEGGGTAGIGPKGVLILYCSGSGTAKRLSERLQEILLGRGIACRVSFCASCQASRRHWWESNGEPLLQ